MYIVNFIQDYAGNLFELIIFKDGLGNEVITISPIPL